MKNYIEKLKHLQKEVISKEEELLNNHLPNFFKKHFVQPIILYSNNLTSEGVNYGYNQSLYLTAQDMTEDDKKEIRNRFSEDIKESKFLYNCANKTNRDEFDINLHLSNNQLQELKECFNLLKPHFEQKCTGDMRIFIYFNYQEQKLKIESTHIDSY